MKQGSYALFIDDLRKLDYIDTTHTGTWWVARSSAAAIDRIKASGLPSFIAFDHDLGLRPDGTEDRSTDVLKWLDTAGYVEAFPPPKYAVHSDNHEGGQNIHAFMQSWAKFWRVYKR